MSQKQMRAAQEERERQREHEIAREGIRDGARDPSDMHQDLLDEITSSEKLQKPSKKLLKNLLSPDWVLANIFNEKYLVEIKYKLEVRKEMFIDLHPAEESVVKGEFRKYVYDNDSSEMELEPLSDQQILAVNNLFDTIWLRVTRSYQFEQQEVLRKTIRESNVNKPDTSSKSEGLLGRFR